MSTTALGRSVLRLRPARSLNALLGSYSTNAGRARTLVTDQKKEFLCICPDRPGVSETRKKVKGAHYEGIKPQIAAGRLVAGGVMVEAHPEEGEEPARFKGSVVVYTGESADEVRKILESDAYAIGNVWDTANIQIIPYIPAVRKPM